MVGSGDTMGCGGPLGFGDPVGFGDPTGCGDPWDVATWRSQGLRRFHGLRPNRHRSTPTRPTLWETPPASWGGGRSGGSPSPGPPPSQHFLHTRPRDVSRCCVSASRRRSSGISVCFRSSTLRTAACLRTCRQHRWGRAPAGDRGAFHVRVSGHRVCRGIALQRRASYFPRGARAARVQRALEARRASVAPMAHSDPSVVLPGVRRTEVRWYSPVVPC